MIAPDVFTGSRRPRADWIFAGWVVLVTVGIGRSGWRDWIVGVAGAAVVFAAFAFLAMRGRAGRMSRVADVLAGVLVAAPMVWWAGRLLLRGEPDPLETALLPTCRNLMLALLARGTGATRPLAWGTGAAVCIAAGLYVEERLCAPVYVGTCVLGCFVLQRSASQRAPELRGMIATCAVVMVACLVAVAFIGADEHLAGHAGFMPTSGGTGDGSDAAVRGVGDGPDLVEAKGDARSIGFDKSDVFVNSEQLGLYDAFVESFGEPPPPGEQQRMIGLKSDQIIRSSAEAQVDLRRGRQFALRRTAPAPTSSSSTDADALLWIDADQSQHVRLRTYDQFDGQTWHEAPQSREKASLHNVDDPVWMVPVEQPYGRALGPAVGTTITTGRYADAVLPMPAFVTGFRLGRVNRTDFFAPAQGGYFRLKGERLPSGSVLNVQHRLIDPRRRDLASPVFSPRQQVVAPPCAGTRRLMQLAAEWSRGATRGWPQVDAVVAGLRAHARLDRTSASDGDDPLDDFLARRAGASYHFATAAAVAMNALGYDVRVVGGFYGDARRRDARSGHIVVGPGDAHVWCEIRLNDGTWMPIEATPGFALATTTVSAFARVVDSVTSTLAAHRVAACIACGILLLSGIWWRDLLDRYWTTLWRLHVMIDPGRAALHTIQLLSRRANLARSPRDDAHTIRRWLNSFHDRAPADCSVLCALRGEVERLLYSSATVSRDADGAAVMPSLAAARLVTWRMIRGKTSRNPRSCR